MPSFRLHFYHLGYRLTHTCRERGAINRHTSFFGMHDLNQTVWSRQATGMGSEEALDAVPHRTLLGWFSRIGSLRNRHRAVSAFGNRIDFPARWLFKLALRVPPGETLTEGYVWVGPRGAVPIKGRDNPTPVYELIGPVAVRSRPALVLSDGSISSDWLNSTPDSYRTRYAAMKFPPCAVRHGSVVRATAAPSCASDEGRSFGGCALLQCCWRTQALSRHRSCGQPRRGWSLCLSLVVSGRSQMRNVTRLDADGALEVAKASTPSQLASARSYSPMG